MKDIMRSWIEHLVLNAVVQPGYPKQTLLVMENEAKIFTPLDGAAAHLENLLNHYWQGLSMPLRFFPRSSYAFATKGTLEAARKEWRDDTFNNRQGEGSDPAILRCFGATETFDKEFCSLAVELLAPMIETAGEKAQRV